MHRKSLRTLALGALCTGAVFAATPLMAQGFTPITPPATGAQNVFVDQIGNGNEANVNTENNSQFARLIQDGNDNIADIDQEDDGAHIATLTQTGTGNNGVIGQTGNAQNVAIISQTGDNNGVMLSQNNSGLIGSAAEIVQNGNNNGITLTQDGDDNQARLTQDGSDNLMIATQMNGGNRLEWMQQGSSLSGTVVEQTGNQQMFIMQTGSGSVVSGSAN